MRAVNLIPTEAGRGGSGGAGGGIGPWAVLGVLGLLLAGVVAYVLTNNAVVDRRAELTSVSTQAEAAQAQAAQMRPYTEFASLAQARVETVRQLGAARFDWHRAFTDLTRVLPDDVWLTSVLGTVTTGVSIEGGAASGSTGTLRSALPNPAIELVGCTTGQDQVARLISRRRLMTGVTRVTLSDTTKDDSTTGDAGGSDCRYGHKEYPLFGIVIFFEPLPAAPAPPSATAAAPASGTATPAASTTPAPSEPASSNATEER